MPGSGSPSWDGAWGCHRRPSPIASAGSRTAEHSPTEPRSIRELSATPSARSCASARTAGIFRSFPPSPRGVRGHRVLPDHRRGLLLHEALSAVHGRPGTDPRPVHSPWPHDDLDRALRTGSHPTASLEGRAAGLTFDRCQRIVPVRARRWEDAPCVRGIVGSGW